MKEKWITMKQAAALVGVTDITIKNWINKGLLSFQNNHRCFRVDRNQVKEVAKSKTELCEAIRSVDEALTAYKEELRLYEEQTKELRERRTELRTVILDKKKAIPHFDWMMTTIEGLFRGILYACGENLEDTFPEKISDILAKLVSGETIDEIANYYGVSIERIRQHIRKGEYLIYDLSNRLYNNRSVNELLECICYLQDQLDLRDQAIEAMKIKHTTEEECEGMKEINRNAYVVLETNLMNCNLSIRTLHLLKYADIETIRELVQYTKTDLLKFRNMGKKSVCELEDLLESHDLKFGMTSDEIEKYEFGDTSHNTLCSADFVRVAKMKLTEAVPELSDYRYLYFAGYRTVLDMIRSKDSYTFKRITGIDNKAMTAVILFMKKYNLSFSTHIRSCDFREFFSDLKQSDD